jgi:CRP-like cAMP-binding protein
MSGKITEDIDYMSMLRTIELFKDTDMEDLYRILRISRPVRFKKSDTIAKKGSLLECTYVVIEGRVSVFAYGTKRLLTILGKDCIAGKNGTFFCNNGNLELKADEDCTIMEFSNDDFNSMVREYNSIAFSLVRILSRCLRNILKM